MPWATENVHIEKQQLLSAAKRLNDQGELDSVGQNVFDSRVRSAEADCRRTAAGRARRNTRRDANLRCGSVSCHAEFVTRPPT